MKCEAKDNVLTSIDLVKILIRECKNRTVFKSEWMNNTERILNIMIDLIESIDARVRIDHEFIRRLQLNVEKLNKETDNDNLNE